MSTPPPALPLLFLPFSLSPTFAFAGPAFSMQRRQRYPTPVQLLGIPHGWRSLIGCSPWGCEESDTTERLHFHFSLSCIGEGNGNPLQCSCLENPRDGGAWWAAVSGVAQSRTRLKRLSRSSSLQHSETEFQFPRMVTGLMKHSSHYVTFSPPDWCFIDSTFK